MPRRKTPEHKILTSVNIRNTTVKFVFFDKATVFVLSCEKAPIFTKYSEIILSGQKQAFSSTFSSKFRWQCALQMSAELAWLDQWLRWSWPAVFFLTLRNKLYRNADNHNGSHLGNPQERHNFPDFKCENNEKKMLLCNLCPTIFNFCAFCNRSRPIYDEKCRCLNDVRTWWQIANLQTADSKHFASQRTWNNQGMIAMTRSCIFSLHHPRLSSLNISMEKKKHAYENNLLIQFPSSRRENVSINISN